MLRKRKRSRRSSKGLIRRWRLASCCRRTKSIALFNVALSSSKVEVVMWLVSQVASDRISVKRLVRYPKACCCRWCNRCRLIYRRQTLQRSSMIRDSCLAIDPADPVLRQHMSGAQHGAPGADGRRQLTQKRARGSRRNAAVYSRRQQHAFFLVILAFTSVVTSSPSPA